MSLGWRFGGELITKVCLVFLFFCNIATPYYDVMHSPLFLPAFAYKKLLMIIWHFFHFTCFGIASYQFRKKSNIWFTIGYTAFTILIYQSKLWLVEYPDCCSAGGGNRDKGGVLDLCFYQKGKYKCFVWEQNEHTLTWPKNATFTLLESYEKDGDCWPCSSIW